MRCTCRYRDTQGSPKNIKPKSQMQRTWKVKPKVNKETQTTQSCQNVMRQRTFKEATEFVLCCPSTVGHGTCPKSRLYLHWDSMEITDFFIGYVYQLDRGSFLGMGTWLNFSQHWICQRTMLAPRMLCESICVSCLVSLLLSMPCSSYTFPSLKDF